MDDMAMPSEFCGLRGLRDGVLSEKGVISIFLLSDSRSTIKIVRADGFGLSREPSNTLKF